MVPKTTHKKPTKQETTPGNLIKKIVEEKGKTIPECRFFQMEFPPSDFVAQN
jgi:hypothetical protein